MDSKIVSPSKRMLDVNGQSPQEDLQQAMALTDEDLALVTGAHGGRGFHHHHHHRRRHRRHRSCGIGIRLQ